MFPSNTAQLSSRLGDANPKDPVKGWDKTWAYLKELNTCIEYYPTGTGAVFKELGPNDTRYEFECYDTSHLYNLAHFVDRGLVQAPFFVQTVFGILGGIGSHPDDVMHMKRTADRLFGKDYRWSVLGAGRSQMPIAAMSASMGGNVRVGLEDSLWIGKGTLAQSNAQQVRKVREIIEGLGLEIATPAEARDILQLKGKGAVAF